MTENKNRLRVKPAPVEESKKEEPAKKKKKTKTKQSKVGKRQKETDGRLRFCIGLFFVLISVFMLIAFASPSFLLLFSSFGPRIRTKRHLALQYRTFHERENVRYRNTISHLPCSTLRTQPC